MNATLAATLTVSAAAILGAVYVLSMVAQKAATLGLPH